MASDRPPELPPDFFSAARPDQGDSGTTPYWELAAAPAVPSGAPPERTLGLRGPVSEKPPEPVSEKPPGKDFQSSRYTGTAELASTADKASAAGNYPGKVKEVPLQEAAEGGAGEAARAIAAIFGKMNGQLREASEKASDYMRLLRAGQLDDTQRDLLDRADGVLRDLDRVQESARRIEARAVQGAEPPAEEVAAVGAGLSRIREAADRSLWQVIAGVITSAMKLAAQALIALTSWEVKEISLGIPPFFTIKVGPDQDSSEPPAPRGA
jgi:hypothetical protein